MLRLDENIENPSPLEYELDICEEYLHRIKREMYVDWNGVSYKVPPSLLVLPYKMYFQDSGVYEPILFLSDKRFAMHDGGIDVGLDVVDNDVIPKTWDWDELKKWADTETNEVLKSLLRQ